MSDRLSGVASSGGSEPRPVGGYIRVSRVGGRTGEGYISPDEQREGIDAYAKQLNAHVPDDAWFKDEDYSGGSFDRPAWEDLIARIESGELEGVIVWRIDRFARNLSDGAAQVKRIVDELGGLFGSAQERMDPTTDTGRYMLQLFLNNAELQLNMFKTSWRGVKERAIARGAHIGPTPLGYSRVPKGQSGSGTLLPDPAWSPLIVRLFNQAADQGEGNGTLATWANSNLPRPDGKRWTSTTVGHVLANRVYRGEVSQHARIAGSADLLNADAHEALVDERTWKEAQRGPATKRTTASRVNLLAGLIRCAGCRYRMVGGPGGKKGSLRVYRCTGNHGGGKCQASAVVKAELVEEWTVAQVQQQWQTRLTLAAHKASAGSDSEEAANALEAAREELEIFAADHTARKLLGDGYHAALEARVNVVAEAEAAYEAFAQDREAQELVQLDWSDLTAEEVRDVLGGAIDAVFLRRNPSGKRLPVEERALIVWRGELDDDIPTRGRSVSGPLRPFIWPKSHKPVAGKAPPHNAK